MEWWNVCGCNHAIQSTGCRKVYVGWIYVICQKKTVDKTFTVEKY